MKDEVIINIGGAIIGAVAVAVVFDNPNWADNLFISLIGSTLCVLVSRRWKDSAIIYIVGILLSLVGSAGITKLLGYESHNVEQVVSLSFGSFGYYTLALFYVLIDYLLKNPDKIIGKFFKRK